MPLEVIEILDTRVFTQDYADTIIAKVVSNDVSAGFNLNTPNGLSSGSYMTHSAYDFIRDRVSYNVLAIKELPGGAVAVPPGVVSFDALMRNTSVGWWRAATEYGGTVQQHSAGQPNLQTGQQKMYVYSTTNAFVDLNQTTGAEDALDVFPSVVGFVSNSNATTGNAGYFLDRLLTEAWNVTIFEGITDSTLMPEIETGGPTHPLGLALMNTTVSNLDGGVNKDARWTWIDLDTGNAVGTLDIPIVADTNSVLEKAEPSIGGFDFQWLRSQFVPDVGSTFAKPKGELHVFSMTGPNVNYDIGAQSVVAPDSTFTSVVRRNFVSVYDFNPFDEQGGTVRVHNRRIFLGIFDIPFEPIIESGNSTSAAATANDNFSVRAPNVTYHPPSRTYISHQGTSEFANSEGADDPRVGDSRIIRFRRSVVVASIGQPVPETAVTESRTIRARVDVLTDAGDRAISAPVTFTLHKVSTRDEQFNGTTQGAGTYTVDNLPIDDDGHLEVRKGGGVDTGGTLMVDPTEYTVVHATGVLTPVGSWPTQQIHVRYRHRSIRVGAGHGTLLAGSTVTDANGIAFASITYGVSLEGELDELEATA